MNPCCRFFFSIKAPVKGHLYRSVASIEIAQAGETEGTCTITHIGVESHLGLEADASGNLVVAHIIGNIVLNGESCVLDVVTIGEQLVAEVHIRLIGIICAKVSCKNLHEGEEAGVGATYILYVGIGDKQLIREIVGETAVEVGGISGDLVHLIIHRIAEQQTILADHVVCHA